MTERDVLRRLAEACESMEMSYPSKKTRENFASALDEARALLDAEHAPTVVTNDGSGFPSIDKEEIARVLEACKRNPGVIVAVKEPAPTTGPDEAMLAEWEALADAATPTLDPENCDACRRFVAGRLKPWSEVARESELLCYRPDVPSEWRTREAYLKKMKQLEAEIYASDATKGQKSDMLHSLSKISIFADDMRDDYHRLGCRYEGHK